eukprot:gene13421-9611_t
MAAFEENIEQAVHYRVTGKQSVERLDPLFQALNSNSVVRTAKITFQSIATYPDNKLLPADETRRILEQSTQFQPLLLWETTCEKELKPLHQQAVIRNKLLNNTVLESKANFAFLQFALPDDLALTTFVADSGQEVLQWCVRRWNCATSTVDEAPPTSDWWVVKASAGNGGRDIWMVHAQNYLAELQDLPDQQEYVIQQYVAQPMLYLGSKKFHFRCYGLMVGSGRALLYQKAFILTAGLDYDASVTDSKRHITNLSVNKHIPKHPGQIPCHVPFEFAELYPRIQRVWGETVAAAVPFMEQVSATDFEFCGLDVIADAQGRCWLIEVNRLPGLESSKINTQQEDELYDEMMQQVLQRMFVVPLCRSRGVSADDTVDSLWDDVTVSAALDRVRQVEESARLDVERNSADALAQSQRVTLQNLLRWKMFRQRHRRRVLAQFN